MKKELNQDNYIEELKNLNIKRNNIFYIVLENREKETIEIIHIKRLKLIDEERENFGMRIIGNLFYYYKSGLGILKNKELIFNINTCNYYDVSIMDKEGIKYITKLVKESYKNLIFTFITFIENGN